MGVRSAYVEKRRHIVLPSFCLLADILGFTRRVSHA